MSKTFRTVTRILAASALAVGGTVGLTQVAEAGTNESITVDGGRIAFHHRGDVLTAIDSRGDHRCVRAHLQYTGGGPNAPLLHELVTACGAGKIAQRSLGIPEDIRVDIQVCYVGGGLPDRCSRFQAAHS